MSWLFLNLFLGGLDLGKLFFYFKLTFRKHFSDNLQTFPGHNVNIKANHNKISTEVVEIFNREEKNVHESEN
jgi:hypothetical protein